MKILSGLLVFLLCLQVQAQQNADEAALQKTVETFFEGFHAQDSLRIRSVMADSVIMQSIGRSKEGETVIHNETFGNFLKSIVSIPAGTSFREELHSFEIKVDGNMANVWTPYSFYFDGKFSHCGSNSFQLLKDGEGKWKIFYLVDTRRKEGCNAIGSNGSGQWEDDIQKFETADKASMPKPGMILFTGSSSVAFWKDLQQAFPDHRVLNRGFGGSEFSDLLQYSDRVIYPYQPSKIFIYEGDNDLANGESIASILKEAKQLREEIKEKLPNTRVYFISPKPSLSRWNLKTDYETLNSKLREYAEETELTEFVDIWKPMLNKNGLVRDELFVSDGLHMNEQGYSIWKQVLQPYLEE